MMDISQVTNNAYDQEDWYQYELILDSLGFQTT